MISNDIGCNYVNMGGVGVPTDYCMEILYGGSTYGIQFDCNDTWNGVNLGVWVDDTKCDGDPIYSSPWMYENDTTSFYCKSSYQATHCDEVSLTAYNDSSCTGDFSEIRLITDACINKNDAFYSSINCTEDSASVSLYTITGGDAEGVSCYDDNLVNTTRLEEGGSLDSISAGCVMVDDCYDTLNPTITDIGCNYVNLGGIAMPIEYCMSIAGDTDDTYYIDWECNSTWNGVNLRVWYGDDVTGCDDEPFYTEDYSAYVYYFCELQYITEKCSEVSLTAYNGDYCSGQSSEIRLITNECFYSSDYHYSELTCSDDTATLTTFSSNNGICDEEDVINATTLNEGSIDSEYAGCIQVDGCYGEQKSEPNDVGCNYMALSGMAIPTSTCTTVVMESGFKIALKFACNNAWNGEIYQKVYYDTDCESIEDDEKVDEVAAFNLFEADFYCAEEYEFIDCKDIVSTVDLEIDLINSDCSDSVLSKGTFITNECLHNFDHNIYEILSCSGDEAKIEFFDDTGCSINSFIGEHITEVILTNGEVDGTIFEGEEIGCVNVASCNSKNKNQSTSTSNYVLDGIIAGIIIIIILLSVMIILFIIKKKKQSKQIKHVQLDETEHNNENIIVVPQDDVYFTEKNTAKKEKIYEKNTTKNTGPDE